ncbi:hypothetical protein DL768_005839 [Monosporascus sp. mg162]|nr:hypothetical protein DL768_005839 [Monosporascus sp. mg162]
MRHRARRLFPYFSPAGTRLTPHVSQATAIRNLTPPAIHSAVLSPASLRPSHPRGDSTEHHEHGNRGAAARTSNTCARKLATSVPLAVDPARRVWLKPSTPSTPSTKAPMEHSARDHSAGSSRQVRRAEHQEHRVDHLHRHEYRRRVERHAVAKPRHQAAQIHGDLGEVPVDVPAEAGECGCLMSGLRLY